MKKISEMTQTEINALSDEEYKNISPFDKRSCYHCNDLKSALSHWCGNKEAIKARGTSIPGCVKCTYWTPNWDYIDEKYKTEQNNYVKPPIIEIKDNNNNIINKWYDKLIKFLK